MTVPLLRDTWLLPTLERMLAPEQADALRDATAESYWEAAVRLGFTTDEEILAALATRFRMKIADLDAIQPHARELLPEALIRKYRIVPVAISDSTLEVATADPTDIDCEGALAFASGRSVRLSLASPLRIAEVLEDLYRPAESAIEKLLENVADKYDVRAIAEDVAEADIAGLGASDRPVIRLVDYLIAEGITSRASDIHLEPEDDGVAVRYRIDGVLRQTMKLPRPAGIPLVSRVKIMAQLDIADRLRPQDGRARMSVNGNRVDLRVSTLPASQGEKVVIRILDSRGTMLSLDSLGFTPHENERIQALLGMREG
ncbi:MAG TPA: ATPase, T2SS/T4P/T4SS family, partial [Gemmatimonadaceae bacterium]|nr:ATPase, T2SS/T4P/T4SS family [Gemmatimonadaceae bacterium]